MINKYEAISIADKSLLGSSLLSSAFPPLAVLTRTSTRKAETGIVYHGVAEKVYADRRESICVRTDAQWEKLWKDLNTTAPGRLPAGQMAVASIWPHDQDAQVNVTRNNSKTLTVAWDAQQPLRLPVCMGVIPQARFTVAVVPATPSVNETVSEKRARPMQPGTL